MISFIEIIYAGCYCKLQNAGEIRSRNKSKKTEMKSMN